VSEVEALRKIRMDLEVALEDAKQKARDLAQRLSRARGQEEHAEAMARKAASQKKHEKMISMCTSKVRFDRQGEAVDAAASMLSRGKGARVYACPHCSGWHITGRLHKLG
jgi:hypothetical protein